MSPPTRYSLFPSATSSARPSRPASPQQEPEQINEEEQHVTDTTLGHESSAAQPTQPETSQLNPTESEGSAGVTGRESAMTLINTPDDLAELKPEPVATSTEPNTTNVGNGRKKAPPASIPLDQPQTMRSMFPTYDEDRPLNDQYYLPSQMSPSHLPIGAMCKSPYSAAFDVEEGAMEKEAEKAGLVFKPVGQDCDAGFTPERELPGMWAITAAAERKVKQDYRLRMRHAQTPAKAKRQSRWRKSRAPISQRLLTFGASGVTPFMSVSSAAASICPDNGTLRTLYNVQKHGLNRFSHGLEDAFAPGNTLADFTLKQASGQSMLSPVPPELRNGIEVITSFIPGKSIASTRSTDTTSADHSDSDDDVSTHELHDPDPDLERQRCYIVLRTYPGQRRPCYALKHQNLGFMRLKIDGDVRLDQYISPASGPPLVGRIELLAPIRDDHFEDDSQSMGNAAEPEIVLASLDLVKETLFIDGAAVADVDESLLVETAIPTLIAVLLAETNSPKLSQQLTFAPPPATAMELQRRSRSFPLIGSRKVKKQSKKEKAEEEVEQALSAMFGIVAVALSYAVEKLGSLTEKEKAVRT